MNEKMIKYFAGEMSSSEKEEFERIIILSPSLQEEVAKYRDFFSNFSKARNPEIEEDYFINLIPKFREKLEFGRKKRYHPVFSFASAVVTVIIILLFIPNSPKTTKGGKAIVGNYSTSEITDYLLVNSEQPIVSNLPADFETSYDSVLDGLIYNELDVNEQNLATADLIDRLDYNTLIQSVNPNDASVIYEQLKNKKIF
jgi:hypothetical protein